MTTITLGPYNTPVQNTFTDATIPAKAASMTVIAMGGGGGGGRNSIRGGVGGAGGYITAEYDLTSISSALNLKILIGGGRGDNTTSKLGGGGED